MSDSGLSGSPAGPSHSEMAARNASQRQGNGKLLAGRAGRDVSRQRAATMKRGSSTRDQAVRGQS